MKELVTKTFVQDSKRPTWLIELLYHVKTYFPFDYLEDMTTKEAVDWIERSLSEVNYVRRNSVSKLKDFVCVEKTDTKLMVTTAFKNKPMVEFEVKIKEGGKE